MASLAEWIQLLSIIRPVHTLTAKNLTHNQHFHVGCKEEHEDEANHQDQRSNCCHLVSVSIGYPPSDEQTKYFTSAGTI